MRKYEVDWIRNIGILLLFVYHTAAIFCSFGDFYVISENKSVIADVLILFMFVWYMPLLFFIAGGSTFFSLKKRTEREYLGERIKKLLVPFLFGLILIIPPQTYLARIWRGESNINYFEHIKYFFLNVSDFSGFDGKFTPAHLWFVLYLFVASIIGYLFIRFLNSGHGNKPKIFIKELLLSKLSFVWLLLIAIVFDFFPSIMGKSIVSTIALFILGYIVYEDDRLLKKLCSVKFNFLMVALGTYLVGVLYVFFLQGLDIASLDLIVNLLVKNTMLISMLIVIIGYATKYLNRPSKVLKYLNESSFSIYLIHQPILLFVAFVIIPNAQSTLLAIFLIIVFSVILTYAVYETVKKIPVLRFVLCAK